MDKAMGPLTIEGLPPWLRDGRLNIQGVSLVNYVGNDHARDEARRLVGRIAGAERFRAAGLPVPRALLVAGPYGVGKTHLARVIAAELGGADGSIPCFEVNASQLSPARIEELGRVLPALGQRIVIVVDEIDAVAGTRPTGTFMKAFGASPPNDTLIALLSLLDGLRSAEQVTWIFTTSADPESLDGALMRPGRVDLTIVLEAPRRDERAALVRYLSRDLAIGDDLDAVDMADAIGSGATAAMITGYLSDAMALAIDEGSPTITAAHFDRAVARRMTATRRRVTRPADRRRLAVHEAGHAIVAAVLGSPPNRVEIRSIDGVTTCERESDAGLTAGEARDRIAIAFGGLEAERTLLGDPSLGSDTDMQNASGVAVRLVTSGCSTALALHPSVAGRSGQGITAGLEAGATAILAGERARAAEIVAANRERIEALAARLTQARLLAGSELAEALMALGLAVATSSGESPLADARERAA